MTSREDSVLATRDPSLHDENDWEEFSLSEVRILVPGKSRYANLLAASADNPVQVTGCLDEVEEEQERLVLDEDYLSKRIVIENVTHYAYGQHNDGEVGIWVSGRAGWFSISPAKGYRPMFSEMVEAIDLLYFLADRHQKKRRKRKDWNPSLEYLCEEYVSHTHGICEDADDSLEVFYKHHAFLFSRMLKGEEGVRWVNTNLFAHLCEKFPDAYEEIKAEHEAKENHDDDDDDDDDNDDHEPTPEEQNEIHSTPEKPSHPTDPTAVSKTQAETIYQVILDLKEAGHLAKRQLNIDLLASHLVDHFEIGSPEYAMDLIDARAKIVLKLMDEAKTSTFDWSRKAIYRELKTASKRKKNVENITLTPLRPRADEQDSSNDDSEEHEDLHKSRRRRVRKSVLRPKSSVSTKQIGKRTRSTAVNDEDDLSDEQDAMMHDTETPSKVRGGHELVRDPLSTRAKRRTHSILSDPPDVATVHRKTPLREMLQSRNTPNSGAEPEASDMEVSSSHPDNGHDPPTDTWTCQVHGCGEVIHKSSSKRSKELIQAHCSAHDEETKTKLDLVFAEKELNVGLPVDNLLSRIKEMGTGLSDILDGRNGASTAHGVGI